MFKYSSLEIDELLKGEGAVEPESIRMLSGDSLTDKEVLKLLTKSVIRNSDAPFIDFYVFEDVVHALNDLDVDTSGIEGAEPEHIWYALQEIKKIRPDYKIGYEVAQYITYFFREAGLIFLPPEFSDPEDNPNLSLVMQKSNEDNLVDNGDILSMQAIHYLKIMEYIKSKN